MSAPFMLRSPLSPMPGEPTSLVSVSWIGLCVTGDCVYLRKSEKEQDLTTGILLLTKDARRGGAVRSSFIFPTGFSCY